MTSSTADIPDSGGLHENPLPRLLMQLYHDRYAGALDLSNGRSWKRFIFQGGAPALAESNLTSETLGVQLMDSGDISPKDHERVSDYMKKNRCREGTALLSLDVLPPKALFVALKEQVRRRLLEAFGWADGRYKLDVAASQNEDIQPFRCDLLALVQEGLETHWSADRLLADLAQHMELYPIPKKGFERLAARLQSDAATETLLGEFDGQHSLGQALGGAASSRRALAAAWVLEAAGGLECRSGPREDASSATGATFEAEVEIHVNHAQTSRDPLAPAMPSTAQQPDAATQNAAEDRADGLRAEIEARRTTHQSLDHYSLLGLEHDAKPTAIKKAYFLAAKRYHPDALARLGLHDLKEAAAEIFARISRAFEILSNEDKRSNYDSSLRGEGSEIDATQLAQAETSYRKGEILLRMGNFNGALEYLRPAAELWPDESAYQSALGWALYKKSPPEIEAARMHLERAVELAPEDAEAHFRLGLVLRADGEEPAAAQHLAKAKQLDPSQS